MKKILITGATGYLAGTLMPYASELASVVGVARNISQLPTKLRGVSVDITSASAVMDVFSSEKPDAVIHCAACNPGAGDDMFAVNEIGSANVAAAVQHTGCRLVSVSTDMVFAGDSAPYSDNAPAAPIASNDYGVSKANAEQRILSLVPDAIVVRTSLIYGNSKIDRATAGFAARLDSGELLRLFTDVIRQPVYDMALSESLCDLALNKTQESGIINIVGEEAMSRYRFVMLMLDYWGIDYKNKVEKSSAADLPGVPLDCRLTMDRAHSLGFNTPGVSEVMRYW